MYGLSKCLSCVNREYQDPNRTVEALPALCLSSIHGATLPGDTLCSVGLPRMYRCNVHSAGVCRRPEFLSDPRYFWLKSPLYVVQTKPENRFGMH